MLKFDLSNLSERERLYFDIMRSHLVLFLHGIPGSAKSAIGLSICKKVIWWDDEDSKQEKHLGMRYEDLRLSDKDETDLGSYPIVKNTIDQLIKFGKLLEMGLISPDEFEQVKKKYFAKLDDIDILTFGIPDWSIQSNTTPTIIHVEELNRCDIRVRNAALQLLNEKIIGSSFKFNKNVFWMASGNLGEMDKTEVEEMDSALSNRLVILNHDLYADEWAREYGREHCWGVLVDYLVNHPDELYKPPPDGTLQYATARSWTHLSDYVLTVFGPNPELNDVITSQDFRTVGMGCVGVSITAFITYCEDTIKVSIKDIIDDWKRVKDDVITFNRSRTTELINNLKAIPLETLQNKELENVVNFLKSLCSRWEEDWIYEVDSVVYYEQISYRCKTKNSNRQPNKNEDFWERVSESDSMKSHSNDDEITNYLIHLIDSLMDKNRDKHSFIIKVFRRKSEKILEWVNNGRHKKQDGTPDLDV